MTLYMDASVVMMAGLVVIGWMVAVGAFIDDCKRKRRSNRRSKGL